MSTPLHLALKEGNIDVVSYFIKSLKMDVTKFDQVTKIIIVHNLEGID